jgi:hypothetical protein
MGNVQFFNFGNDQTYHFFQWVSRSGMIDPKELISKAMEQVEDDDWFKMGSDVSTVARDKLADLLEELLEEVTGMVSDEWPIGAVGPSDEALTAPILQAALNQIDFHAVATALLISAGKWAPDRELPEAI